jgi:tetratricopeptide (TPR) repeat protein
MTRSLARNVALFALLVSPLVSAQAVDAGAAREQLKQGYALKQQGKFAEALPHLLESLRLDPQVKTLMNLADTEEHVGKWVDATRHWVQARDKAASAGDDTARAESAKRRTAAEARTPKLTIVLKGADPSQATVKRDAVVLGAVSLGESLPTDPGAHVILVEMPGFESRTFEVTLKEGEAQKVEVSPGAKLAATATSAPPPAASAKPPLTAAPTATPASNAPPPPSAADSHGNAMFIGGLSAAGVGVVLLAVSLVEYSSAKSKHNDAVGECANGLCPADAFAKDDDAHSAAKTGNVLAVVGGILAVGGGVTALLAPRSSSDATTGLGLTPTVGVHESGLTWKGAF